MRTTKIGTIMVDGNICCNEVCVEGVTQRFDTVTQARKYLANLKYSGSKVKTKNTKLVKHGEFYFKGSIKKIDGCNIKTIDII